MSNEVSSNTQDTGKEGIIDFLSDDSPLKEESDDKKVETKEDDLLSEDDSPKKEAKSKDSDEEDLEISDDESEEEIPSDDTEIELITPVKKKEILAKYPKLFKDFPYLEAAYYREQQYSEILPTITDAKEAVERASQFNQFETDLLSGNTESVLKSVKAVDEKAYGKIVDNYLTTLGKVDKDAYYHVIGNVIKQTIQGMAREADNIKNDSLRNAALILNQYVFGTSQYTAPGQFSAQEDPRISEESKKLETERQQFAKQRYENAYSTLSNRVDNRLRSTIEQNIDPKGTMPEYVKKNAVRDAINLLQKQISSDSRFQTNKDNLWKRAISSDYSRQTVEAIESAYLGKAKTLLRDVINRTRNEALRSTSSKRSNNADEKEEPIRERKSPPVRQDTGQSNGNRKKMSTLDFLNKD